VKVSILTKNRLGYILDGFLQTYLVTLVQGDRLLLANKIAKNVAQTVFRQIQ
jgi:hypothetical protein